jgi:hypothetical protein
MRKADRAWCSYRITDAMTHFTTLALTIPEAARAVGNLWRHLSR